MPRSGEKREIKTRIQHYSLISTLLTFELNWLIEMWLDRAGFPSLGVTIRLQHFSLAVPGTGGGCVSLALPLLLFLRIPPLH